MRRGRTRLLSLALPWSEPVGADFTGQLSDQRYWGGSSGCLVCQSERAWNSRAMAMDTFSS